MTISAKAFGYCIDKLGTAYSQSNRFGVNPYVSDCSSLVYRAYLDAGYKMSSSTSCYEVYDEGFDLLFPAKSADIGKHEYSLREIKAQGYKPMAGDLIFFHTTETTRPNKITHVAIVENSEYMIHARSAKYGVVRNRIDIYGRKIVAVTRFKESTIAVPLPRFAVCNANDVNIRKEPNAAPIVGVVSKECPLVVSGSGDWINCATIIDGKPVSGYIYAKYTEDV